MLGCVAGVGGLGGGNTSVSYTHLDVYKRQADYIRMIRLQRAAQLLKQKEYTITEIAEIVGFSDAKYFREVFKKYYNVSPSKFVNSDQE